MYRLINLKGEYVCIDDTGEIKECDQYKLYKTLFDVKADIMNAIIYNKSIFQIHNCLVENVITGEQASVDKVILGFVI